MLNLEAQAGNPREIIVPVQPKHLTACRRLLQDGMLPRSVCSRSLLEALQPLFDTGIVHWEKAAGGQRLAVANLPGLERWFRQHFPETQTGEGITSSRIHAVARFRDSKALPSNLPEIVCLRTTRDGGLLRGGQPVETTKATRQNGVFALTLTDQTSFTLIRTCALIENPAVFHDFERLKIEPTLAIYAGGCSSNRLVSWLKSNSQHGLKVLHLPDYDPLGLTEFLRLAEQLGDAITLHLPGTLSELFHSHSKAALLADSKNQRMLIELRQAKHPSVRSVVKMIDESNGGLEQESLLIRT